MTPLRWWLVILLVVWAGSGVYVGTRLTRGWVPHDEGTLGQSAERVAAGQLPHRDYDEIYTGGLAYLDALAFRVFGENLVSPRIALFLVFLLWVPAVFYIASRFLGPWGSGGVTLLAVSWSLPNYAAAMPSWFNLFFATFGAAALLRFAETDQKRWLFTAGLMAGLSCLIKIIGIYFIAGSLLVLVAFEQRGAAGERPGRAFSLLISAALALFVAVLWMLVRNRAGASELVAFVFPGGLVAAYLAWAEWSVPRGRFIERVRRWSDLAGPLLAGVAVPIAIFALPYILSDALPDLWRGVFVTPTRRFAFATTELPRLGTITAVLVPAAILLVPPLIGKRVQWWVGGIALVVLPYILWQGHTARGYRETWFSMRWLIPAAILAGVVLLVARRGALPEDRRRQVLVLLAVAAACGLVQFPYSSPIYFMYAAPLGALAAAAVVAMLPGAPALPAAATLAFYVLFAVRWIHPGFIYDMGLHYSRDTQTVPLAVDRGGLLVTPEDADVYSRLVATVRSQARGPWVYATPDCPEVNFLTDTRNPTRDLFEFFEDGGSRDATFASLDAKHVNLVVINTKPAFSPPLAGAFVARLATRFPNFVEVGRFEIRWRE
jgi:hypothetical protein